MQSTLLWHTSSARPPSTSASYSGPREVLGKRGKLSGSCLTRCLVSHSPPAVSTSVSSPYS